MDQITNVVKFDNWMKHIVNSAHYGTHGMNHARRVVALHQINSLKKSNLKQRRK